MSRAELNSNPLRSALKEARAAFGNRPFRTQDVASFARKKRISVTVSTLENTFLCLVEDTDGLFTAASTSSGPGYRFNIPELSNNVADSNRRQRLPFPTAKTSSASAPCTEKTATPAISKRVMHADIPTGPRNSTDGSAGKNSEVVGDGRHAIALGVSQTKPATDDFVSEGGASSGTLSTGSSNISERARANAHLIRCVAPLRVDGGTSLRLRTSFGSCPSELRNIVRQWKAAVAGNGARLPKGVTLVDDEGVVVHARFVSQLGGFSLVFGDEAQIDCYPRKNLVLLQTKAEALWGVGVKDWLTKWLGLATFWTTGQGGVGVGEATDRGWLVEKLELACDFTGLEFSNDDAQCFAGTGFTKKRPHAVTSDPSTTLGVAETINIGSRGDNRLCVSTHNKTNALRAKKNSAADSAYASTWLTHGWDGKTPLRRVEVRAHGKALNLAGRALKVDIRLPASLLDTNLLATLWSYATTQWTRLVVPKDGDLRSKKRAPVDPRWEVVQAVGGEPPRERLIHAESRPVNVAGIKARRTLRAARALGELAALFAPGGDVSPHELLVAVARDPAFKEAHECARSADYLRRTSVKDDAREGLTPRASLDGSKPPT